MKTIFKQVIKNMKYKIITNMMIRINARALELGYAQQLNYSEDTKIIIHINMDVSQILFMYITCLITLHLA